MATLSPKTVFITGCSEGGLGGALALEFHRRGFKVIASARTPSKMANLEALGVTTVPLEVTSAESIASAVERVTSLMGDRGLDFLINNAGVAYQLPLADTPLADMKKIYEVNVFAVLAVTQAFLPLLIKARGTIANNSSIASMTSTPIGGTYASSKAALNMISDTLRIELAPLGVKVVLLMTGAVATNIYTTNSAIGGKLPANSLYAPAQAHINAFIAGDGVKDKLQDRDRFARNVVGDLIRPRPSAAIWRGAFATIVWFVSTFLWRTALDGVVAKQMGFGLVRDRMENGKKED